ncbi:hypothetical protein QJS10_CPB14g00547 [Acorus calamus]|uniref:Uncharacterized protein n=1 Tax=Acorus calamus TaxID=4465 RepID=A0AAV9DEL0_ACOCL|nr:hypothetical protein QJS10_CPB14g00547 [Acorus calamus]
MMILSNASFVPHKPRGIATVVMTASNPSQLRRELDVLHREAEQTRSKEMIA